jgi:hypothetical protein
MGLEQPPRVDAARADEHMMLPAAIYVPRAGVKGYGVSICTE